MKPLKTIKMKKHLRKKIKMKKHLRKKIKSPQLEEKLNKDLENELIGHWKEFREVVLDDSEKPFKYKKYDVCQCIRNYLKTGKFELPNEIKMAKEWPEILSWNNIISYEKFFKSK